MLPVLRKDREFEDVKTVLQNLDFSSNFNGRIVELSKIQTGAFKFPHGLSSAPSGRIILRQVGGGHIVDSQTIWDDKYIYMENQGTEIFKLTLMVLR